MLKRLITSLFCLFLIFVSIPVFGFTEFFFVPVYADSVPDGYSPCGFNDQVDAFKSYCQSRNLVVEGSGLDVVTSFTSNAYQGLITKAGLDVNELQNQIYKATNDNVGAKWFFTSTGIAAFNRIFAELLQNNDLEVGDSVNKNVYDGYYGANTLLWNVTAGFLNSGNENNIIYKGSQTFDALSAVAFFTQTLDIFQLTHYSSSFPFVFSFQ